MPASIVALRTVCTASTHGQKWWSLRGCRWVGLLLVAPWFPFICCVVVAVLLLLSYRYDPFLLLSHAALSFIFNLVSVAFAIAIAYFLPPPATYLL